MKASLQTSEPQAIARWEAMDLYGRIRAKRTGAPKFILHDGPPYANGLIHVGTALNKILKDFIVKARSMAGFDAPYVPGWDCHGLPIELNVDRELGSRKRNLSVGEFRRACRSYAEKYVGLQRDDFRRLGVLGTWSDPYLTMNYGYQAAIVRALGRFVAQGEVYRGKKPVHWCIHCETALAEAEVEYEQHSSPSIYVEFPMASAQVDALAANVPELSGRRVSTLIWTTTPWTIPSNLALAFHPELIYGAYDIDGTIVLVAEPLAEEIGRKTGRSFHTPLARIRGGMLERLRFRHPLYERDSLCVVGEFVVLDQGTGVVHIAPGHGADDFQIGVRYELDIYAPVGPGGRFADEVGLVGGLRVFDANPKIEEALATRGRLWLRETLEHTYPHCWRCRNPVILLATWQWFIAMDTAGLRANALEALKGVEWFPAWGQERIHNMLANRPDWCISRQRSWGVPIPAIYCKTCRQATITTELVERTATVFERYGADAWYERPIDEFLPPGMTCPSCGQSSFERERDILDVWFDSGSSHEGVLAVHPDLRWPADVYLEGTDQHRGWFHSSLLVALRTRNAAPYRQVITHGFVVDEQGRKMSRSRGNVVAPQAIIQRSGAEILRLWVAMVDYREEMRIGDKILSRVIEAYRKIRNTFRILVANLYDFDPSVDALPLERLQEVDRYALARYADAAVRIVRAYDGYEFQTIFHTLNSLMTVDLSAFYVDVSKDRLYTLAAQSEARRSAQTAIYHIADGLVRLVAPILPVTADELWQFLSGRRDESVHLSDFPADIERLQDPELVERWSGLIRIRNEVNRSLECARQQKLIGDSLAAYVELRARGADARLLSRYRDDLPMLFITSGVSLEVEPDETATAADRDGRAESSLTVGVRRIDGVKCPRCWRYVATLVRDRPDGAELCGRCLEALSEPVGGIVS